MFIIKSDKKNIEDGSSVTCPRIMSILTISQMGKPSRLVLWDQLEFMDKVNWDIYLELW